jgi:methylase of polypeptide subunit release factors
MKIDILKLNNKNKTKQNNRVFSSDIASLINDLYKADYITNKYEKMGINSLIVLKGVFRPDKSYLGDYLVKILNKNKKIYSNKNVLDLGCGSGILGLICSVNGANSVYFSDINPIAIKNSKINSLRLGVKNIFFSCGDLFENIPSCLKFDLIIFNPPTINGKPKNKIEMAFIRGNNFMSDFFSEFKKYLNINGKVIIPSSTRFNEKLLPSKLFFKYNLICKTIAKENEDNLNSKYVLSIKCD